MPELILWMNQEIDKLKREMDLLCKRLIRDFDRGRFAETFARTPRIEMYEESDRLVLRAELPNLDCKDLDVSITDDVLFISGEQSEVVASDKGEFRRTGAFQSKVPLPCKVKMEEAQANYKEGLLEIILPKSRPEAKRLSIRSK